MARDAHLWPHRERGCDTTSSISSQEWVSDTSVREIRLAKKAQRMRSLVWISHSKVGRWKKREKKAGACMISCPACAVEIVPRIGSPTICIRPGTSFSVPRVRSGSGMPYCGFRRPARLQFGRSKEPRRRRVHKKITKIGTSVHAPRTCSFQKCRQLRWKFRELPPIYINQNAINRSVHGRPSTLFSARNSHAPLFFPFQIVIAEKPALKSAVYENAAALQCVICYNNHT